MAPTLYSFSESGNSYKVRLLAALLKIDLTVVEVDFIGDEQHSPAFLAINPRGEVPVLVDGDKTFTDSAAILTYLSGTYSDPGKSAKPSSFWATTVADQAAIIDWLAFAASWVQYGVFTARAIVSFQGPYNGVGTKTSAGALEDAVQRGNRSLEILQTQLAQSEWLALGRPTVADIGVFVYVALAPMGDISLKPYPAVEAWIERVKALPGFIPILGLEDPFYRRKKA